jgi:hypothetical protein
MLLLGGVSMHTSTSKGHFVGAVVAALLGGVFFFAIVGVFGLPSSIVALLLFIALALMVFRRPQSE